MENWEMAAMRFSESIFGSEKVILERDNLIQNGIWADCTKAGATFYLLRRLKKMVVLV
ncbi:MAG: hypothetical protein KHX25_08030 [Firmicutes bacterium]|jgi:hypothetical protein|nr:hypothetical protein [Bacillota bacterium]